MSQSPFSNPLLNLGMQAAQRLAQEALGKFQNSSLDADDLVAVQVTVEQPSTDADDLAARLVAISTRLAQLQKLLVQ